METDIRWWQTISGCPFPCPLPPSPVSTTVAARSPASD